MRAAEPGAPAPAWDAFGDRRGIDLNDPKDDITAENIKQVMDDIILKNIFKRGLNAKIGAQIVTKTVQELVLA